MRFLITPKSDARSIFYVEADRVKVNDGFAVFIRDEKDVIAVINCEVIQSIVAEE